MLKDDFLTKQLKDMVRTVAKLILKREVSNEMSLEDAFHENKYLPFCEELLQMAKNGQINEAENKLYHKMDEDTDDELFQAGLLFYDGLNDLEEDFLDAHDYSKEEVKEGIQNLMIRFGYESFSSTFLI